jgi:hypothetical protein
MEAKCGSYLNDGLGEGRTAPQPFRNGEDVAGESTGIATAGIVMSSENREARRAVVMDGATADKATAVPAEFNPEGGEIFR